MAELDDTGRELLGRLVALNSQITDLTAAADEVKNKLREHCGLGAFTDHGVKALSITPNRRFNADRAIAVLPPELVALCTVPQVVSGVAKKNLPPALFEACTVEVGKPVVKPA